MKIDVEPRQDQGQHQDQPDGNGLPRYVDGASIRKLTPILDLVAALREVFKANPAMPPRHSLAMPGNATMLLMPAWQVGGDAGVKILTVHPDARPAIQATYLLLDGRTGKVKAVLDGTMLTPRRTAAASALAGDMLAKRDARVLLMIGTGTLVPHLVEAHRTVRDIDRVLIWGRDASKAQAHAIKFREADIDALALSTIEEGLAQADIVSAATLSTQPLIDGRLVRPGTHLDLVGAFHPGMSEADPQCFARATVFVDTRQGALEEAGDLLEAIAAGAISASDIAADLAELCAGVRPGRSSESEITLFKSVGASIEDLVAAEMVVRSLEIVL